MPRVQQQTKGTVLSQITLLLSEHTWPKMASLENTISAFTDNADIADKVRQKHNA